MYTHMDTNTEKLLRNQVSAGMWLVHAWFKSLLGTQEDEINFTMNYFHTKYPTVV